MDEEIVKEPQDTRAYLHYITNNYYSFTTKLSRVWTNPDKKENTTEDFPFFQLIPESESKDDGFFDWYIQERPYNQLFKTKETCLIYFVNYWTEWARQGKFNPEK